MIRKKPNQTISLADRVRMEALEAALTDMFEYYSKVLKLDEVFNKPGFITESKESICLASLILLDIFRGVRKYVFPTSQNYKTELSHLMDRNRDYPAHYPKYLLETAKELQQAGREQALAQNPALQNFMFQRNPLYMNYFTLKDIDARVESLVFLSKEVLEAKMSADVRFKSFGQNTTSTYCYDMNAKLLRRMMVSDQFFDWLCKRPDINTFMCSIVSIFELLRNYNENPYTLIAHRHIAHGMATYKVPIQHLKESEDGGEDDRNLVCLDFPRFLPRSTFDGMEDLLKNNYFHGKVVQCVYLVSATPSTYDKEYFYEILNTQFIEDKKRYLGHAKSATTNVCSWQERKSVKYIITRYLPAGSVESRTFSLGDGGSRRQTTVELPFEFVDVRLRSFDSLNFFKYLTKDQFGYEFGLFKHNVGQEVLKILEAIPGFEYSFNKDQIKAIEHTLGSLVVGRSGTGKTTCAVMRMVGYRLLEIAKRNLQNGVRKVRYQDLCDPCTFRMVFLTASPLLAKNVKHLYIKVIDYLKDHLKQKEQEIAASREAKQAEQPLPEPVMEEMSEKAGKVSEPTTEGMDEAQAETEADEQEVLIAQGALDGFDMTILDEKDLEIDQLIGEIDLENDPDDVPSTFEVISRSDFPIFTTYRKFLTMLDSMSFTNFYWSYYNRVLNHRKGNPNQVPRDRKIKYSALSKILESSVRVNQGREWLGLEQYPEDLRVQQDEIHRLLAEGEQNFERERGFLEDPRAIIRLIDRRIGQLREQLAERIELPRLDQLDRDLLNDLFDNTIEGYQNMRNQYAQNLRQGGIAVPNANDQQQQARDEPAPAANPAPMNQEEMDIVKLQESGIDPKEYVIEVDYEAFETQAIPDILESNKIEDVTRRNALKKIHPRELWGQVMKHEIKNMKSRLRIEEKENKDKDLIKKLKFEIDCLENFQQCYSSWKILNGYYDLNDFSSKVV